MESNYNDENGRRRGERRGGRGRSSHRGRGAKTFRRGRAIAFLESMNLKRATIQQQLEQPEFQSIEQILIGELKAIDVVISEFRLLFDIHESELEDGELVSSEDGEGKNLNEEN